MGIKNKNILYFITRWFEGTAYKNINFMKDNFGGEIIKDDKGALRISIDKAKPDLMVIRGDARDDFSIPLRYKIPYLLIEHDINSLRRGMNKKTERHDRTKVENASAIIFTSEEHADYYERLKKRHNWKIPYYEIIHTRPLKKDLDFSPKVKLDGLNLVYAGGVVARWNKNKYPYGYRCYHEIFKKFIKAGWRVHIYSASYNTNRLREYKDIGCIIHENLPYKKLLQDMSQYTAGLHSYNKINVPETAYAYTQTCRGNKIWDYLAAGIPTIGFQAGNGVAIYINKWGVAIDDLGIDTLKRLPERLGKIRITKKMRFANVMDKDIKKYKKVLKEALKAGENKVYVLPKIDSISPFPKIITVENRGKLTVYRANHTFIPYEETEPFMVNESDFKLIKAHVQLKINIKE